MTIRSKLILWYSGLLAIIIIVFSVSMFAVSRWVLVNSVDATLAETADQVLKNSRAEEVREFDVPARIVVFLPRQLDLFRASGVVVQVWQISGSPLLLNASTDIANYDQPLDPLAFERETARYALGESATAAQLALNDINLYTTVRIEDGSWRVYTLSYEIRGWRVLIQAAASFDTVDSASQGLLIMIVVSATLALSGSVLIGSFIAERVVKPIDAIASAAVKITAADDLKNRLQWSGPNDEMGRLVSVYNAMIARLEHLFSVQQRFVADVSHELRTPLTAIKGNFELIQRYGIDPESLDAIHSEVTRMERLVNDLLLLARADYGGLDLHREPLEMDEVLSEAYREAKILAKDRDLKITISAFEPVRVSADASRIGQLLSNLISNAIKFTPDGGAITLSLSKTPQNAVIEVSDTGIGMQPDDLKRIFDRFYQADASRVRFSGGEGVGLGLSIAKWIVDAHRGQIEVSSEYGAGTTFRVLLPHMEEPDKILATAVTRPRLSIIRRNSPHQHDSGTALR